MRRLLRSAIQASLLCSGTATFCAAQPTFEVASIKRTDQCSMHNSIDPGVIALAGDPLIVVVTEAFQMKKEQISGPSWLNEDCFDIVGRQPPGATRDQLPAMLQQLLVSRFGLTFHNEGRQEAGYALVVEKNGPKFTESEPVLNAAPGGKPAARFRMGPTAGIKASVTMDYLASYLSGKGYGPVTNATGLNGKYDIDLAWTPDPAFERLSQIAQDGSAGHSDNVPAAPDLQTAIRESLGLRLEPRKIAVNRLVIDHIERTPTEN